MAGFFSLGGGGGAGREETSNHEYHHHHQENTSTHNWFLYKNHDQELPTYKGFELWQQQHQQQQQQQSHNDDEQNYQILRNPILNPFGLGHDHHHGHGPNMMMMRSSSISISCQDCGNQAKKDCQHMRCRTCCKSRGFQCQTHVKSTWVPAAKRRERQQQLASLQQKQEDDNKSKRQKDDTINTGLEVTNNFPSKVNSTALFQRVRMSSIEENEDQIAYQAVVNINGHIFKGILYDQGDNNHHEYNYMNGGDSSSGGDPMPHQHNLNITGIATSDANNATGGCGDGTSAEAAEGLHFLETSLYSSAPLINTFVGGTQFFPHPRS